MANTPLYKPSNTNFDNGNLGLWFHKFSDKWKVSQCKAISKFNKKKKYKAIEWSGVDNNLDGINISKLTDKKCNNRNRGTLEKQKIEFNKIDWIKDIAKKSESTNVEGLEYLANKIKNLADEDNIVCYLTSEPLIIGMGLNHPIENGMLFHHTLGVPYLPGSSVKGLVRAWAEEWVEKKDKDTFKRIFGSENKETSDTQAGSVIFFDALPISKVLLKLDIMTPHYPKYYGSQGKEPPADNQDPSPIPFLTIAEGVTFQFAFKDRKPANKSDIETVKDWLKEALENLGAGAKTAVGYGRMTFKGCPKIKLSNQEEKTLKEENRLKNRGEADILIENNFQNILDKQVLEELSGDAKLYSNFSDNEKKNLAQKIKVCPYYSGLTKNAKKKWRTKLTGIIWN